ncbi:MAG: glycosyltransferase family 4 protein [Sphingomonadaceae bacterium]
MAIRILHCHSTFDLGGKEARAVRLMNAFGPAARHVILSAVPGALGARVAIDKDVRVTFPERHPSLTGRPTLARFRALAEFMRDFDLILTYNWGAMDAVMARRIHAKDLPPLIHHEDGFNADEAVRLKTERNLFRRLGLPAARALVVPSERLETIALNVWKQPRARVVRIANGIDTAAYARKPTFAIPGLKKARGEVVVGTLAGLRGVKNLPMLVRVVAAVPGAKLVIVGEGPEREAIRAEAARVGMADRLVMPGFLEAPHRYIGHFDVFALSSLSEQFPISLVEAMAAGLPAVATDVGDVRAIVAPENLPFIVGDEAAMVHALRALVGSAGLRRQVGEANRTRARTALDEATMIARYRALYGVEDLMSGP